MDSPINEEMIYCNLAASVFKFYQKCFIGKIESFFDKYDPRKSINQDYLVKCFEKLYGYMAEMLEEL